MGELHGPRVAVRPLRISAARLEKNLRSGEPPVITMVQEDAVLIDPRTLIRDQCAMLPGLVATALGQ